MYMHTCTLTRTTCTYTILSVTLHTPGAYEPMLLVHVHAFYPSWKCWEGRRSRTHVSVPLFIHVHCTCNHTLAATVCMHVRTCTLLFLEMSREEEVVKRARLLKVAHVQIIDMQAVTEH